MRLLTRLYQYAIGIPPIHWDLVGEAFPLSLFALEWRHRGANILRQGDMQTCPVAHCRKTFVRTEIDPKVEQICPLCRQNRQEHPKNEPVPRPHLVH